MKGESPFDTSVRIEQKYSSKQSPSKEPYQQHEQQQLSQEFIYRLQRVFEEAGHRQQKYISIIKQQQEKLKKNAEEYLQHLREVKSQFLQFIDLKKNKTKKMSSYSIEQAKLNNKKEKIKFNSKEFSLKTKIDIQKQQKQEQGQELQPYLACKIHCYYYTPFVQDFIREIVPENMILKIRTVYPNKQMVQNIKIIKEEDEYSNIKNLIEKIPFQISTPEQNAIIFEFQIPCELEAINYYRNRQFQLELVNTKGLFIYAYAKISLASLLYYEDQEQNWPISPLNFYSALDGKKLGEMAIKLGNRLQKKNRNDHYKIQSTSPLEIKQLGSQINYHDEQSRMIQRISKFKTNTNSLLLGIGSTKEADAQKYFQRQNDKIIMNHRKRKELDSIQQYKNSHKQEMLNKLFNDAINRYYLSECEIGKPKFIIFNFLNKERQHRKIGFKTTLKLVEETSKVIKSELLAIQEYIHVSIVNPSKFKGLMDNESIQISTECHYEYDMDQEEQSLWAMSGMWHPIVLRIICLPPKPTLLKKQNLQATYNLTLTLNDDYDRQLQKYQTMFVLKPPNIQHKLYIHGYHQSISQLQIPLAQQQDLQVAKTMITNENDLENGWDNKWSRLTLNIRHNIIGDRQFYVIINDEQYFYQLGCYLIAVSTYNKLDHSLEVVPGQIIKVKFDFTFDQKTINQKLKQNEERNVSKVKAQRDQIRVYFASSKPEHCYVSCQNELELICKLNKIYQVQAKIQSFDQNVNPEKLIIHAVDADKNLVIKKWLIELHKEKRIQYKNVFKLYCEHGKALKYKFQLRNQDNKQKSFRLYSSNLSIMKVPMNLVSLISNQIVNLDLQFLIQQSIESDKLGFPLKVILTVSDGTNFNNYLFELTVKYR